MKLDVDDMCFACGRKNPIGLKLQFNFDGDDYVTTFEVRPEHQGWAGIVHGGIVATLLDETMTRMLCDAGTPVVTADLHVRLKQPVPLGMPLQVRARIRERRKRVIETEAEVVLSDGAVAATGEAKLMVEELS